MKLKLTAPKIVNLIIILVVLFLLVILASLFLMRRSINFSNSSSPYSTGQNLNPLPSIDPVISDELPQRVYQHLKDSLRMDRIKINGMYYTNSSLLGPIGIQQSERCEGCSFAKSLSENDKMTKKENLIRLVWWKLDSVGVFSRSQFYVKNGQSYLRKNICKLTSKTVSHTAYNCTEKDIPVAYRYDTIKKNLMIPISDGTMRILKPIFIALNILFITYCLYFILGNFIKFLIEIAQGNPFSANNLKRLKVITLSLFGILLAQLALTLLPMLIFRHYLSSDIVLNTDFWKELAKPAALYLIFAVIWAAFINGKQLKEDNDLKFKNGDYYKY